MSKMQEQINSSRPPRPSLTNFFWPVALGLFVLAPLVAYAGTISSSHQYAWSNDAGWVNFAPSQSTVTVSDSGLSGYAWSQNDGWINLSPSQSGVTNSNGTLGGFAWDPLAGWVNFSGVTIDSSGKFHGEANGSNSYAINFDCANCDVETDWRLTTTNTNTNTTSSSPGSISPIFISAPLAAVTQAVSWVSSLFNTLPIGDLPPGDQPPVTHTKTPAAVVLAQPTPPTPTPVVTPAPPVTPPSANVATTSVPTIFQPIATSTSATTTPEVTVATATPVALVPSAPTTSFFSILAPYAIPIGAGAGALILLGIALLL